MVHYHGTPIGSSAGNDKSRFYKNRHCCVSFAHPDDLEVICDVASSFFVDSGAFSFWRGGTSVDWDSYMEWIDKLPRIPDFYLVPDVIGGTENENRSLLFKYGRKHGAVPVYHLHETTRDETGQGYLEMLVSTYGMVAIGSSGQWPNPGTDSWWERMSEVLSVACDENGKPRTRLHGLRQLDPAIFGRIPYHSCDSTNAARNNNQLNRFGMYVPVDAPARSAVIADRIESWNSPNIWLPHEQESFQFHAAM